MSSTIYQYRTLARVLITAESPIRIGSGEKDLVTDSLVIRDSNGLPYIPGSALAGVIRSLIPDDLAKRFGFAEGNDGYGSEILISDALMVYENGQIAEGLTIPVSDILSLFEDLPLRQHVRIGARGTGAKGGKYDEQIVFKGSRFCFEMELCTKENGAAEMDRVLRTLSQSDFRIGGGSRRGFGAIRISDIQTANLNLAEAADRRLYLEKNASLNSFWPGWKPYRLSPDQRSSWTEYRLMLRPEDFFLFGSGISRENADIASVLETVIEWNGNVPVIRRDLTLIPASSIKGALSHRTAFHYNRIQNIYADHVSDVSPFIGKMNRAISTLFGSEGDSSSPAKRGNVIVSDIFAKDISDKLLNHIAIDSFTGGTIDGAKFDELVKWANGKSFELVILVQKKALEDSIIKEAFESALDDLCTGILPLGGGTMRGHGTFYGTIRQ